MSNGGPGSDAGVVAVVYVDACVDVVVLSLTALLADVLDAVLALPGDDVEPGRSSREWISTLVIGAGLSASLNGVLPVVQVGNR